MTPAASLSRPAWRGRIHRLERVDSTNSWLRAEALRGAELWTAVTAKEQAGGRGRRGHAWSSPRGGLYLSVLLDVGGAEGRGVIPLLAGVAVAQALSGWGISARLKWPNDVRVVGRKVGGILVESVPKRTSLVVGIGVNVNAPVALSLGGMQAASLEELVGHELPIDGVTFDVLARLGLCYDFLIRSGPEKVVAEWRRHAEEWWGRLIGVTEGGEQVIVRLLDVMPSGALLVEAPDGTRRELFSGDVHDLGLSEET
jgi:BirA family biotin operon repressor/biotin-[acetyl-CoA-carboxylase] ligase